MSNLWCRREIDKFQTAAGYFQSNLDAPVKGVWDGVEVPLSTPQSALKEAAGPGEDKRVYVPGEEWAGEISATHKRVEHKANDKLIDPVSSPGSTRRPKPSTADVDIEHKKSNNDEDNAYDDNEDKVYDDEDYDAIEEEGKQIENNKDHRHRHKDGHEDDGGEDAHGDGDAMEGFDPQLEAGIRLLSSCTTLECVRKAHNKLKGKTKFNAPHFFLIGFQKCATTSVNHYLRGHPEYLPSIMKEAHYFTACKKSWDDANCKSNSTEDYLINYLRVQQAAATALNAATVDASVDYAWVSLPCFFILVLQS